MALKIALENKTDIKTKIDDLIFKNDKKNREMISRIQYLLGLYSKVKKNANDVTKIFSECIKERCNDVGDPEKTILDKKIKDVKETQSKFDDLKNKIKEQIINITDKVYDDATKDCEKDIKKNIDMIKESMSDSDKEEQA